MMRSTTSTTTGTAARRAEGQQGRHLAWSGQTGEAAVRVLGAGGGVSPSVEVVLKPEPVVRPGVRIAEADLEPFDHRHPHA
jgi:hypothetical protein